MRRILIFTLSLILFLPFCSKGESSSSLKLKDFYFYEEKDGKMVKRDSNVYKQGDVVNFYIEVEGFSCRKKENGYEIKIAEILRVYTSEGELVHQREVVNATEVLKELPPYLGFKTKFGISPGARIGAYKVIVDILDGIGGDKLRIERNIRVKGAI